MTKVMERQGKMKSVKIYRIWPWMSYFWQGKVFSVKRWCLEAGEHCWVMVRRGNRGWYRLSRSKKKEGHIGTAAGVGRWSLGEMVSGEILSIFMAEGKIKLLMEKGHCSIFWGENSKINQFWKWVKNVEGFPFVSWTNRISEWLYLFIQQTLLSNCQGLSSIVGMR